MGTQVGATAAVHHLTLPQSLKELWASIWAVEKGAGKQGRVGVQGGSSSASGPLASHPLPKRVFLVLKKWSAACHSPLAPNSPLEMLLNLNPNAEIPTYAPFAPSTPSLNTDVVISWRHTHHVIQFSPKVFIEYLPVPGTATINSFMLKGTYILRGETNMGRSY